MHDLTPPADLRPQRRLTPEHDLDALVAHSFVGRTFGFQPPASDDDGDDGEGSQAISHTVYHRGTGRPVLLVHELTGLTPACVGFARRLVLAGFAVHMPLLVGRPLQRSSSFGAWRNMQALCVSAEFARLRSGVSAPVTQWLRALADDIAQRDATPRVGVIGMCLTGAFAIPLVLEPGVAAAVVSQPAIPLHLGYRALGIDGSKAWRSELNIADEELRDAAAVAQAEGKHVLVQRFVDDRWCPRERVERIARAFGPQAELNEYPEASLWRRLADPPHALLTDEYDDAGDPEHPTRQALQSVLAFLDRHL